MSEAKDLSIIYEDNHIIVINKRPSQIVQGDKTGDETLPDMIKTYLKKKYNKPGDVFCGVVHRLDRPTSGVLIYARTSKALSRLSVAFKERQTHKKYWAIVEQCPKEKEGVLKNYLWKNEKQNKSYVVDASRVNSKLAELKYKLLLSSDKYHLLEIELYTGRHHQIRCQLANIGCHIKGDLKYGSKRSNSDGSICLHARSLTIIHPTKKEEMTFVAPVPEDNLWIFFEMSMQPL